MGLTLMAASAVPASVTGIAYVRVPDAATFHVGTFVIEAIVRVNTTPGTDESFPIVTKGGLDTTTKAPLWLGYVDESGTKKLKAAFYEAGGTPRTQKVTQTLTVGQWYSLLWTYVAATGVNKLYIATRRTPLGATDVSAYTLLDTTTYGASTPNTANTNDLLFGADIDSAGAIQYGSYITIEEVRIFNAAIAQATAEGRLTTRCVGNESNLIGYWRCDDGDGGRGGLTVRDLAGNGNDGTLVGNPAWADGALDLYYQSGWCPGSYLGIDSLTRRIGTSLTLSGADSTKPVRNLRSPRVRIAARSTSGTCDLDWVSDYAFAVDCLTILGHNLTSEAVITIKANTSASWASPPFSQRISATSGMILQFFSSTQQYKYWRLSIADANNSETILGCVDLWQGMLIAEPAHEPTYETDDPSVGLETIHGSRTVRQLDPQRQASLSWIGLRSEVADTLYEALTDACAGTPVLIVPEAKRQHRRALYGIPSAAPSLKYFDQAWTHADVTGLSVMCDVEEAA